MSTTRCTRPGCLLASRGGYCPAHARELVRADLIREGWDPALVDRLQAAPLPPGAEELLEAVPLPPQGDA